MTKVYLLSVVDFNPAPSYRVIGVFSSIEKAKAYALINMNVLLEDWKFQGPEALEIISTPIKDKSSPLGKQLQVNYLIQGEEVQ